MSKLRSFKRHLDPAKVWLANHVAEDRIKVARQAVLDRAKKDAEFAAEVLKVVGDGLPKEIKEACEESVKQQEITAMLMKETGGLVAKWEKTGLLDGRLSDTSSLNMAVLIESESKQIIVPQGASDINPNVTDAELQEASDKAMDEMIVDLDKESNRVILEVCEESKKMHEPIVGGDTTYKLTEVVQLDGGGQIMVDPNEEVMDGPNSAVSIAYEDPLITMNASPNNYPENQGMGAAFGEAMEKLVPEEGLKAEKA